MVDRTHLEGQPDSEEDGNGEKLRPSGSFSDSQHENTYLAARARVGLSYVVLTCLCMTACHAGHEAKHRRHVSSARARRAARRRSGVNELHQEQVLRSHLAKPWHVHPLACQVSMQNRGACNDRKPGLHNQHGLSHIPRSERMQFGQSGTLACWSRLRNLRDFKVPTCHQPTTPFHSTIPYHIPRPAQSGCALKPEAFSFNLERLLDEASAGPGCVKNHKTGCDASAFRAPPPPQPEAWRPPASAIPKVTCQSSATLADTHLISAATSTCLVVAWAHQLHARQLATR